MVEHRGDVLEIGGCVWWCKCYRTLLALRPLAFYIVVHGIGGSLGQLGASFVG